MKKGILIICLFTAFCSCKSHYQKADEALEDLKYQQNVIDSLVRIPEYDMAMKRGNDDAKNGIKVVEKIYNPDLVFSYNYITALKNTKDSMIANHLEELNIHFLLINFDKDTFKEEVQLVKDRMKQLELIKKFDRIYVLKTER